ncbi:octanoyl-[acyl-carrier-protein]:protein N-octanoyltransferase LIPT2, mitochondrial isoform X2 [Scleropages formosus]|uniref:octanoyl-[acyl-carrier-protein]:protein N-octanoyltransferase LIPT2, mitochondrial isoform X2 n=1 Tax=Scleropages formosus TaxID=113540 RepID=UPI0008784645|nr:putative lipoyltransferase 2, mitochondrial isoform X2 [Scleropages formosus]
MGLQKTVVKVLNLGLLPYAKALKVQQHYVRQHVESPSVLRNTVLLCEHQPVYTIGIRQTAYPAEEEERLKALGAEFFRTNRGGLITFHGPGQLVCYPILHLGYFRKSVRWYVSELERTVIGMCARFGIKATTSPDTGVWVGENKICAIEVQWFNNIVPCGIVGKGVTSLSRELGRDVTVLEATPALLQAFSENFHCELSFEEVDVCKMSIFN